MMITVLTWTCLFLAGIFDESGGQQIRFHTGRQLEATLAEQTSIAVTGAELWPRLQQISRDTGICIVLDRRVDPHSPLQGNTGFVPRRQALKSILPEEATLAVAVSDRFVLIGPAGSALALPVLLDWNEGVVQGLAGSGAADRRQLTSLRPAAIPRLTQPRVVLQAAATAAGVSIQNPDVIPHDVSREVPLPEMSFAELATLILIQFDLCLAGGDESGEIQIVSVGSLEPFERRYVVGRSDRAAFESAVAELSPPPEFRWSGGSARVTTDVSGHVALERMLAEIREPSSTSRPADWVPLTSRTFTLTVRRARIGSLIASFRQQDVPIEVIDEDSPEVQELLRQPVEIDVTSERAETFFHKAFGSAFSSVTVQDDRVILKK